MGLMGRFRAVGGKNGRAFGADQGSEVPGFAHGVVRHLSALWSEVVLLAFPPLSAHDGIGGDRFLRDMESARERLQEKERIP